MEDNNKDKDNNKDDNNYNIRVSRIWDMIETWGFCEDIKDINGINLMMMMMMMRMIMIMMMMMMIISLSKREERFI